MNYAIFRVAKRTLGQASAMARHALRSMPTPNADPDRLGENTIIGPTASTAVAELLKSRTEPFVRRKDAVRVVEIFVGASPEIMHAMSREKQDHYFADAIQWLQKLFGGDKANIVSAVIHRDETTPHMQVLLTPIVDGKLVANKIIGGPGGLVKLQTQFASEVGERHGMRRGERGSRAKHTSVKQFYAAINAAGAKDALPARIPVPPAPGALTIFSSATVKKAHEESTRSRAIAIDANRARENRLIELAKLGLATHGRSRRSLPGRLAAVEQIERESGLARVIVREARELLAKLDVTQRANVTANATAKVAAAALAKATQTAARAQLVPTEGVARPRTPRRP